MNRGRHRRYVWLVWVRPHFSYRPPSRHLVSLHYVRWAMYLQHSLGKFTPRRSQARQRAYEWRQVAEGQWAMVATGWRKTMAPAGKEGL